MVKAGSENAAIIDERVGVRLIDRPLLTVAQAAKLLQTDERNVRALLKSGRLRGLRIGAMKIRRKELDRFLEASEGYDMNDPWNPKTFTVD